MVVGGGLRGAAAVEWWRRQRVEKHGGRWAVERERRTWVSVAGERCGGHRVEAAAAC